MASAYLENKSTSHTSATPLHSALRAVIRSRINMHRVGYVYKKLNGTLLELSFDWIMSGFHRAFATVVACQQGTLTLSDTWFHPPFWDLPVFKLLRPDSSNLPCIYSTFHLEFPLVLSRFCSGWSTSYNSTFKRKFLWVNLYYSHTGSGVAGPRMKCTHRRVVWGPPRSPVGTGQNPGGGIFALPPRLLLF